MIEQMPRHIRQCREAAEITQSELAAKVSVSQAMIARIEKGVTVPPLKVLIGIADVLHLPLDDLIGREVQ